MNISTNKAFIHKSELEYLASYINQFPNIETGGDLFGSWSTQGYPIIQYIIGPGPNCYQHESFFRQDPSYLKGLGLILNSNYGLQHIGTWHSHHQLSLDKPSSHDAQTMASAIEEYSLNNFQLIIGNIRKDGVTINGYLFSKNSGKQYEFTRWLTLPTESPIRKIFDFEYSHLIYNSEENPVVTKVNIINLAKTTLVEADTEPTIFMKSSWISCKEGKRILSKIYLILCNEFENVKIFQDFDKEIFFTFDNNNEKIHVELPASFPIGMPKISYFDKNNYERVEHSVKWKGNNFKDTELTVLKFIKQVLSPNKQIFKKNDDTSTPHHGSRIIGKVFSE